MDNNNALNQLKNSTPTNAGSSNPATPKVELSQTAQTRVSAQASMRERMRAERANAGQTSSVKMEQSASYQPTQQATPNAQQAAPTPTPEPTPNAQQATQTIINTTQSSKPTMSKGLALGVAGAVVAVVVIGFLFLSGNSSSEEVVEDDAVLLDPVNIETFLYTPEETEELRAAGYTGTEIETYQSQEIPAEDLIAEAEATRDAWVQEAIAPLYDTASDEYKYYISQTWLTLPERTDIEEWDLIGSIYTERKNLDYEKIDIYGNQLFLKVYLDDNSHDDWFFLNVTPEEWLQLGDSGNVIVTYTYYTHIVGEDWLSGVEDMDDIYITDASLEIISQ